jgi:Flp pilus assembly protein TadG
VSRQCAAQALVEFALVLLVMCGLLVAALDYGRVMNTYVVIVHATREAARIASIAGSTTSAVQNAASNAAQDTLSAAQLSVICSAATFDAPTGTYQTTGSCGSPLVADTAFQVSVSTTVTPLVPVTGLLFGSFSFAAIPVSYSLAGIVQAGP